eukprot:CAMPEP_0113458008 /NCGR_PEP_ID=MMETSP0014_2-20120614/9699_1 /TAXON_ID=2857 /ORGANISM="Nitzschia sp." /LENGTH=430 /DNA_ID=CAMNT_0000349515 /DNA_START=80 /DNA_END=1369 /DNA_ORIENTATION=+ /assembly_acc=CAM_ASM_000159
MSSFNSSSHRFPAAPTAGESSPEDQTGLLRCLDEIIRFFTATQNGHEGEGLPPRLPPVYHQVMMGAMMNNAAAAAQPGMSLPQIQDFVSSLEPTPIAPSYYVVQGTATHSAAKPVSPMTMLGSHNQTTVAPPVANFTINTDNLEPLPVASDQQLQPSNIAFESDKNHLDPLLALAGQPPSFAAHATNDLASTNNSINENLQRLGVDMSSRLLDGGAAVSTVTGGGSDGGFQGLHPGQVPSSQTAEAKTGGQEKSPNKGRQVYQREQWFDNFKLLLKYREKHGHCNVPYLCEENKALSQWVKRQRQQRKLKAQKRHFNITDEREELLDGIGFCWNSRDAAWDERYASLVWYYKTHGHVRVSRLHDPSLNVWLKRQRHSCRVFLAAGSNGSYPQGQDCAPHGRITKERCQQLLDLGVELGYIKGANGQEYAW